MVFSTTSTDSETSTETAATNSPGSVHDYIPREFANTGRTIVICFDGTLQQVAAQSSNVVEFFSAVAKDVPKRQLSYYVSGIGTTDGAGAPQNAFSKALDAWIAHSLPKHIKRCYRFLVKNYQRGDKVCIFGFSRGAYCARALAAMLCKVGLLPRGSDRHKIDDAYELFSQCDKRGWDDSLKSKHAMISVDVEFVGVWDTVASVGYPPAYLPFTRRNPGLKTFRHAVALDERRIKFTPYLYQDTARPSPEPATDTPTVSLLRNQTTTEGHLSTAEFKKMTPDRREDHYYDQYKKLHPDIPKQGTDALEVWFTGCHSDIGGSSKGQLASQYRLGRIALFWMIRQCFLAKTGILFDVKKLRTLHFPTSAVEPSVQRLPQQVDTADEDMRHLLTTEHSDAYMGDIHDPLAKRSFWRFIEMLPILSQHHRESTRNIFRRNNGRGRVVRPDDSRSLQVHYTVALRTRQLDATYVPRIRYHRKVQGRFPQWVDWLGWTNEKLDESEVNAIAQWAWPPGPGEPGEEK